MQSVSDVLRLQRHESLHQELHVGVDGPHLQEPGQELVVGDQPDELIPERFQTPVWTDCPSARRNIVPPAKLTVDPREDPRQVHAVVLQEVVELEEG